MHHYFALHWSFHIKKSCSYLLIHRVVYGVFNLHYLSILSISHVFIVFVYFAQPFKKPNQHTYESLKICLMRNKGFVFVCELYLCKPIQLYLSILVETGPNRTPYPHNISYVCQLTGILLLNDTLDHRNINYEKNLFEISLLSF